jgi:hypothetical protein
MTHIPSPTSSLTERAEPDWNFTIPPLPADSPDVANTWTRGSDLGPEWQVKDDASAGHYQLLWLLSDTDQDPRPGSACGVSFGTQTDFDLEHHAVRTGHPTGDYPLDQVRALVSDSSRDASTSCSGKQHVLVWANGTVAGGRTLPIEVAVNGSVRILDGGLWLGPGETAIQRIDRWETGSVRGEQQQVHETGVLRVVHLGGWAAADLWTISPNQCDFDAPARSGNCIDRGYGP